MWFQHRAGKVTASNFKSAAHTSGLKPSLSLIKRICYPEEYSFSTEATKWGYKHESTARAEYKSLMLKKHKGFKLFESGLIICPTLPHLGASPDGIIECDCHGRGTIEIKCPFSCRKKGFEEASENSTFFLEYFNGRLTVKKSHKYYYQLQAQMKLSQTSYCDLVVWNEEELIVVQVKKDDTFIEETIEKITSFYTRAVLPELLGRWFTQANHHRVTGESVETEEWCFCRGADEGRMVLCHNTGCEMQWFHMDCVQLDEIPTGEWYCPRCADD